MPGRVIFRSLLRMAMAIPIAALAHAAGFAFALLAQRSQAGANPFLAGGEPPPLAASYAAYLGAALSGDLGNIPGVAGRAMAPELLGASLASLALALSAFALSGLVGVWLGRRALRPDPPAVLARLVGPASIGIALPAFYVGAGLIAAVIALSLQTDRAISIPTAGLNLGWPMLLPVAALALRPALQLAQLEAGLLAAEAGKPYARAAQSLGYSWPALRGRVLFRNTLLPIAAQLSANFRMIVAELVVVEWLFEWPGLGRLLALALVPSHVSNAAGLTPYFLHPPLLAALIAVLAFMFWIADSGGAIAAHLLDPRAQTEREHP